MSKYIPPTAKASKTGQGIHIHGGNDNPTGEPVYFFVNGTEADQLIENIKAARDEQRRINAEQHRAHHANRNSEVYIS